MNKTDLFKAYFTENSSFYLAKLERLEQGKKYSFNFEAGFFGIIWFFYRKMYKEGIIIFLIFTAIAAVTEITLSLINPYDESNGIYSQLSLWALQFVTLGFLGNWIYLAKSKKVVDKFISKPITDTDVIDNIEILENIDSSSLNKLRIVGGTSFISAIVCIVVSILIQIASRFVS